MLFNSYIFILVFLPIVIIGYYGLNRLGKHTLAKLFLCLMSLIFYSYNTPQYLLILLGSLGVNYGLSAAIKVSEDRKQSGIKKLILLTGIIFNLGLLGYFKYYDFFISNVNAVCGTSFNLKNILLPLGISFFTFQQISYVVDRYKGEAPHYKLIDYVSFVTFFPQLVAGPIVLHSELVPQFEKNKGQFDKNVFAEGICIFIIGLAMKVLLADNLGLVADYSFDNIESLDSVAALLGAVTFAFELYFDFAGYSNMAIGIGKMFGIELPDNFNRPFACTNNKETWKCWHMTLGRFFRTYVYFPLGGSRKGFARAILNTMIVFLLSGLWHGADWTFVLWGVMHGLGICVNMIWQKTIARYEKLLVLLKSKAFKIIAVAGNFLFFSISMIFFRCNSIKEVGEYFGRLFSGTNYGYIRITSMEIKWPELYPILKVLDLKLGNNVCYVYVVIYILLLVVSMVFSVMKPYRKRIVQRKKTGIYAFLIAGLFMWCLISFSGVSQFLYFNF